MGGWDITSPDDGYIFVKINPPIPIPNERPAEYATRMAAWYKSWQKNDVKLGQYFTPRAVAEFMVRPLTGLGSPVRILDAGAGTGILACSFCECASGDIELEAYEIDRSLSQCLDAVLRYTGQWMSERGHRLKYVIHNEDFILQNARALTLETTEGLFDIVISNPPYLKISKSDPRAVAANRIVYGQPNLYALFMAIGAALLRPNGHFIFITPRSYTSGAYFQRFREFLFSFMDLKAIHLFDSRKDIFDSVLQESMILWAQRAPQGQHVHISSSVNHTHLDAVDSREFAFDDLLGDSNVLRLSLSIEDFQVLKIFESWTGRLQKYGIEISTGRVVPFRAIEWIESEGDIHKNHAPLFWLQNVCSMEWSWPIEAKPQYLITENAEHLLVPNQNYVLIRRFSPKEGKRLTAAPYITSLKTDWIGLENHLNFIYRKTGHLSENETYGLAIFLTSKWVESYLRQVSGNTQVGATDLRNMPIPPLEAICEIGYLGRQQQSIDIDALVAEVLNIYA